MNTSYDDILHLPHHVSSTRAQMSMADRAAQFSPFAALTGHDAAIQETARLTDVRIELTEDELAALDRKYQELNDRLHEGSVVLITYFQPDSRKDGGSYISISGRVRKIDTTGRLIRMEDGTVIPMDAVYGISFVAPENLL